MYTTYILYKVTLSSLLLRSSFDHKVPLDKEFNEQSQITSIHNKRSSNINLLDKTLALFLGVIVVNLKRRQGNSTNHLKDLNSGDKHRIHPFGLHSDSHEEVITIHEGVHSVVHGTEEDTASGESDV